MGGDVKKCPQCAKMVPIEAITCPFCRKTIKTSARTWGFASIVFITMMIAMCNSGILKSSNKDDSRYNAISAAEQRMLSDLKAPSTAKFPDYYKWGVVDGGKYFQVSSYVDAQNSFGAMIRTDFTCLVYKSDNYAICNTGTLPPEDIRDAKTSTEPAYKRPEQTTAPSKSSEPPDYLKSYPVINKPASKSKSPSDEPASSSDYYDRYGSRKKVPETQVYKRIEKDGSVTFSDNPGK